MDAPNKINVMDKIISFLQSNGPSLPVKVAKAIGSNILLASALLSDLVSQGKVRVSCLKVGGSPLYYLPPQKERLYQFAAGNLNPKDLQVLQTLKEKKVLREAQADLLTKVSLRSLKDFAVPLHVTANGTKELFWKWHLLPEKETNEIIMQQVLPAEEPLRPASRLPAQAAEESAKAVLPSPSSAVAEKIEEERAQEEVRREETKKEEIAKEEPVKWEKRFFLQKVREKVARKKKTDEFFPQIEALFSRLKINIEQKETLRKNAEMNFILKVPTAVGRMTYFCKAKQKKRCDEKDLSSAYMEAQVKKLPLLFLYTQELGKKAEEMLESGAFENTVVRKVE